MTKKETIKQYIGVEYCFLINHDNYQEYVLQNWQKIAYKKVYGVAYLKPMYKNPKRQHPTKEQIIETILSYCEDTLEYLKEK
jgi:hypothetical protein